MIDDAADWDVGVPALAGPAEPPEAILDTPYGRIESLSTDGAGGAES
jgi:hypothetical protein